jgi:hypothetical protein
MKSMQYIPKNFIVEIKTVDINATYDAIANTHAKRLRNFRLLTA